MFQSLYLLPFWEIPYWLGVVFLEDVWDQKLVCHTTLNEREDENNELPYVDETISKTTNVSEVVKDLINLSLVLNPHRVEFKSEFEDSAGFLEVHLKEPCE